MVANITQAFSLSYYLNQQRSFRHPNEYLNAGQEPDGVWFNPNALLDLEDSRKIDSMHFYRLYDGFHPETQAKLNRFAGCARRSAGLDIELSADKSVSALWAIADKPFRKIIEHAHNHAARTAVNDILLKECSYTRARIGGAKGNIHILPAHVLGAMFQHGTSRADDPQLHTHFLIFNVALTDADGKWRALHQKPFYRRIKDCGPCYRSHLAENLTACGIEMERYGENDTYVRVRHIPKQLEKLWSKRQWQIARAAARRASDHAHNADTSHIASLESRYLNHPRYDPELRHVRWRRECDELIDCAGLVEIFRTALEEKAGS